MEDNLTRITALLGSSALTGFASGGTPITPEITRQSMAAAQHRSGGVPASAPDPMLRRSHDSKCMLPFWDRVDAVIDGIDGMRAGREEFLPRFPDEDYSDYEFRLKCTTMTNVYRDIVEGLAGKPFEQPVKLTNEPPANMTSFMEDVDGSGNNLTVYAGTTFFNGINNALDWIFVDYSALDPDAPSPRNRAEEKALNLRPYWSHVLARNVIDVQSIVVNSKEVFTYFKVFEPGSPDKVREFERANDGTVTWSLYEKRDEQRDYNDQERTYFWPIGSGVVSIGEIPMVPFVTGRRQGRTWKVDPQLRDALDLQIELYQGESDLKFAKKLTAFPMLAANGISPDRNPDGSAKKLAVGPARVLYSKADGSTGKIGTWAYVEPNAESLKFLAEENKDRIQQLRELGKQPLTAQSGNITVITAMVAAGKARSAVKAWAFMLKDALENSLIMTAKWLGETYNPDVYVHINFDDYSEGEDLDALGAARERKDISRETFWEEMVRRGVLSSNFDPEAEEKRLLDELPGDGEDIMSDVPPTE